MTRISRFIPSYEREQYEEFFKKAAFTNVLNGLNLGEPENTDIVKIAETVDGVTAIETSKLLDFGSKAQVILKQYEAKVEGQPQVEIGEVVQLWLQQVNVVVAQEYVNGELGLDTTTDALHHVYKEYVKIPEVSEDQEDQLVELMYNPYSCIASGSCCYFEGQRYEHCGQSCGIYHNAGGGTPINAIDRCCRTHDREIRGKKGRDRCQPHRNLLNCMKGLKGPGDTTIRNGIRFDMVLNLCI